MAIQIAEQDVSARAYELWQARGRPDGGANEDWFEAEAQLKAELDAVSSPLEPLAQKAAEVLDATSESPATGATAEATEASSSTRPSRKRAASRIVP